MHIVEVKSLRKQLGEQWVANGISFTQRPLERLAIAGETGSGKSTLLKMIAGLVQKDGGEILFEQAPVEGPLERLLPGHPKIAYLSQHFELRNNYRVEEILDMAMQVDKPAADAIFDVCRISHLLKRRTNELSGGEKQRIATARLLISGPKLLLLDEPYSNLDLIHKNILRQVIHDISHTLQITCILVSHDPADLLKWASRIIVLRSGNIVQDASPNQIFYQPVGAYVAGLFGRFNVLSPALQSTFGKHLPTDLLAGNSFLRPGQLSLASNANEGIAALVVHSIFLGNYFETVVQIGTEQLFLNTRLHHVDGSMVYVKVNPAVPFAPNK